MPLPVPLEYCLAAYHSDYDAEKTPLSRFQTMLSGVKCGKSMSYLGPTPFNPVFISLGLPNLML